VSLQYKIRPRLFLGRPPSPRGYHETILADSRLFLFGGFNGYAAFDDVHILDLAAGAYLPQVTTFTMGSGASAS
jgi:Rab9 effector protein with kelch motifs